MSDSIPGTVTRRVFCVSGGMAAAALALGCGGRGEAAAEAAPAGPPPDVMIVQFGDDGRRGATASVPKIVKTDAEWHQQLSSLAFDVTRRAGTEIAFTGAYWNLHDAGVFRCICCDTALFSSDTKFDSGTGWPSFWAPIAEENIVQSNDASLGMVRIAVSCRRCDAHQGHVFDDGPKPTGLRYCMNSVSMRFVKRA